MFVEIKKLLIEQIESLLDMLEFYEFEHITYKQKEIRFARDIDGGQNISIKLENNENLMVRDFVYSISEDIFAFIMRMRNVPLRDILLKAKSLLNLDDSWEPSHRISLFGGIFDNITKKQEDIAHSIPEETLDKYDLAPNFKWIKDRISITTQEFFKIGYDVETDRITIPIRNEFGELIGVKGRLNYQSDVEPKYLYLEQCPASKTLFGYSENYQYLYGNEVIVCESEKAVMQAHSFGVRNVVGLASNNLSEKQAKLLLQLNPTRIIIALDEGLDIAQTKRNIAMIRSVAGMFNIRIAYWDSELDIDACGTKNSPTDMGKKKFDEIMKEQLIEV